MSGKGDLFDTYLSEHYKRISVNRRALEIKKHYLRYNYHSYMPADRSAAMLEIGPGFGELLELLVNELHYSNASAIDISREVVDHCNAVVPDSTTLVSNTADYLNSKRDSYDCICMFHVLEHVPKPELVAFLDSIHQALVPGGKLILEVPNMGNPITGLYLRYGDLTHEVGFTDLSLSYLMQRSGFSTTVVGSPRMPIDSPKRLGQRLAQVPIDLWLRYLQFAYASLRPKVLTPNIFVVAEK